MNRTIIQRLFNPAAPHVEGRLTFTMNDSFIIWTQVALINHTDQPVMYDYSKCEPFLIDRGDIPYKLFGENKY